NPTASTGSFANTVQYTGRNYDSETGLRYYRARYYSSDLGRFLSEDPTRFDGAINFYIYVGNNPIDHVDPSGLRRLTPDQCDALRRLLAWESADGTYIASLMGNITFNTEGFLWPFNSSAPDYEPVQSARGPINLDW